MPLPRWRIEQKKRKEKKRLSLARKVFLLIIIVLFLGIGVKIWFSIKNSVWDGRGRLNLVFNTSPISVASFNPNDKTLHLLLIPDHTLVETIHGYGLYKAGSIWKLGKMEGHEGEFFVNSFQEYLGIPMDAYASASSVKSKDDFLKTVWFLLKGSGETNLTTWDLIRLWWATRNVRFDKVTLVDLGETSAVSEIILPDGAMALETDFFLFDQIIIKFFSDSRIKNDGFSIGVYNRTDHPGLAKKAARLVNNIGGRVVEVRDWKLGSGEWEVGSGRCEVRSEKKLSNSYTVKKLMNFLNCQYRSSDLGESQVELLVIIDEAYWKELTEK